MRPSLKRMHMIALGAVVLVGAGVACIDGHLDAGVTAWVSASSLYSSWVGLLLRGRGQGGEIVDSGKLRRDTQAS